MERQENRLLTHGVLAALSPYPLYSQEATRIPDMVAVVAFRLGNLRWYVCEGNAEGDTFTLFGLVCGFEEIPELGYINADELASVEVDGTRHGLPGMAFRVEQDRDFMPRRLADIADEDVQEFCAQYPHHDEAEEETEKE